MRTQEISFTRFARVLLCSSALVACSVSVSLAPAQAQTTTTQNYLNMAPGESRFFIGGTGTRNGSYYGKTGSWTSGDDLMPSFAFTTARSPLQKRIMTLQNYRPLALSTGGSTSSSSASGSASTDGSYQVLLVYRLAAGESKPTKTIYGMLTLSAQAYLYGYEQSIYNGVRPNQFTFTKLDATANGQPGIPGASAVNANSTLPEPLKFDLSQASLASGESDIYVMQLDGGKVSAHLNVQYASGAGGNPTATADATTSAPAIITGYSPDPNNLALDDCSTPAKGLNQYVISQVMPTSVSYTGGDANFTQWLKNHVSWNISGTAPALRPVDTVLTTSSSVAPGHYPQVFPTPQPPYPPPGVAPTPAPPPSATVGFDFDVRSSSVPQASASSPDGWIFPSNNSSFGVKTFNHVVAGTTVAAPIALFYPATGMQPSCWRAARICCQQRIRHVYN